jgi:hypothetical protein
MRIGVLHNAERKVRDPTSELYMNAINLEEKLSTFSQHYQPRTVAQFNGHDVMVVKVKGPFSWHKHDETDDFFLVLKCVRLGMTKTALGHSTSLRQNAKAVCIGVAGRKILGFVTMRKKPASTISATANGSGASTRALSHAAYRSCSGAS